MTCPQCKKGKIKVKHVEQEIEGAIYYRKYFSCTNCDMASSD